MRDLQERSDFKRLLRSPIFIVFLLVVILLFGKSVYGIYKKDRVARINRAESERKLLILREKERYLLGEISKLNTDRGIEEELRNKFQISKAGEGVLVVVDDGAEEKRSEVSKDGVGSWRRIFTWFGYR